MSINKRRKPTAKSRFGNNDNVRVKKCQVVNRDVLGLYPRTEWGWMVTVDDKPYGDPVKTLKEAIFKALNIDKNKQ